MILKKGTQVKVIAGKDKGKTGEILEINRKLKKVKIKSINMIKKHTKPTKENKGGIISKENFIHVSNVKNIDKKNDKPKKEGKKEGKK
jgi:large subunit ribosomal protein L24